MKQGLLIAAFVVLGALIIGVASWYVNTNINNVPSAPVAVADQASSPQTQASATSTNTTSSQSMDGLQMKDLTVGTGTVAENGDVVTVDYVGKLDNGTIFDSSAKHGQPFSFTLGNTGPGGVIEGWNLGVLGMRVGGTRELTIPPSLGYGAQGYPGVIPPNATLHFTITLLSVSNPAGK